MTATFAVRVRQPYTTTTTVSSSLNPSKEGQCVTFTATVAATGTAILPTGAVVFRSGTRDLGTAQLQGSGQATLTTCELSEGTHTITAVFQGNGSFLTSTSAGVVQTVLDRDRHDKNRDRDDEVVEEDDDEDTTVIHDDDDNLAHRCRHFRHDHGDEGGDGGGITESRGREWEKLRRRCEKYWHKRDNDWITLVDKGIRRHIEGHHDTGGGGREYWDHRKQRWVPEERHHYRKPHHKKHYHKPVVKHFAVTG
ncbi:Ig-like domain-containing protein [Sphaerisporangium sp. TRM90804]|uniref:Ig-like domain-containing protein n=1 Tax=Sphaerisporangium sp. TRM90804 TaxID=3031113 RepID=UPI002448A792|nr:Ig-like domain-containing protein [Sphaerisporangium sp. TRM90804]MDH2427758.1 Ig-like domain-containing protein [Sphaerisporangium sp. TRM90804]